MIGFTDTDLSMKSRTLALVALILSPAFSSADSKTSLQLSGYVSEKVDYKVYYNQSLNRWMLSHSSNANLKALLVKNTSSQYFVHIISP